MPRTTLGRVLGGLSVSRLHGPEDEKYSLKGALTRVEVSSTGVGRNLLKWIFLATSDEETPPTKKPCHFDPMGVFCGKKEHNKD